MVRQGRGVQVQFNAKTVQIQAHVMPGLGRGTTFRYWRWISMWMPLLNLGDRTTADIPSIVLAGYPTLIVVGISQYKPDRQGMLVVHWVVADAGLCP